MLSSFSVFFFFFLIAHALNPLNDYIRHFEPLSYDHQPVLDTLHRARRAAHLYDEEHPVANPQYAIDFNAHGRTFALRLKRDTHTSVFHPDLVIEDSNGRPMSVALDHLVTGYLADQPNSLVFGSVRKGVFEGRIHSMVPRPAVFYVEGSHKYFPEEPADIYLLGGERVNATHSSKYDLYDLVRSVQLASTTSPKPHSPVALPFHSVIYSSKHVVDGHRTHRNPLGKWLLSSCFLPFSQHYHQNTLPTDQCPTFDELPSGHFSDDGLLFGTLAPSKRSPL